MDETLLRAMLERLQNGLLPCAQAFTVALSLNLDPLAVGHAANEAGIRISHCQLGLFGYGPKVEGKHKIVHPMDSVPGDLASRLNMDAQSGGISCAAVWRIAAEFGMPRLEAAGAVEALNLRVSDCQLGCFPRPGKG